MIFFTFTNSVDPDEMPHKSAFHLDHTVCESTRLWVSCKQKGLKGPFSVKYLEYGFVNTCIT